jgi:hypothetical protein
MVVANVPMSTTTSPSGDRVSAILCWSVFVGDFTVHAIRAPNEGRGHQPTAPTHSHFKNKMSALTTTCMYLTKEMG